MIGNAPKSEITGLPGWETADEQTTLMLYASRVPANGVIVELGCEFGMSTGAFCHLAPRSVEITSVDLFPGNMLQVHRDNMKEAGYEGRSKRIAGDSVTVGATWDKPIDLLFVDADHTFEGVLADIRAWTPHVKVGGVVIFHDTACMTNKNPHYLHFEVLRAIQTWLQEDGIHWQALDTVDTMSIFKRMDAYYPAADEDDWQGVVTLDTEDAPPAEKPKRQRQTRKPKRG